MVDVVFGALSQALPSEVLAPSFSTVNNLVVAGNDPVKGRYVFYRWHGGGYGGSSRSDGLTNGPASVANAKTPPVEVHEQRVPVLFLKYALREESAGAGRNRGGFGSITELTRRRGEAVCSFLGDRGKFAPRGILGGKDALKNRVAILRQSGEYIPQHITKDERVRLLAGEVIQISTPGGGGYGDPFERDPELVLRDVQREYYSAETALRDYGVALKNGLFAVDYEETARLRASPLPL